MRQLNRLAIAPVILVIVLIGLSPFFFAIITSFFHDIYGQRSFAGLENYFFLISDKGFRYSLAITSAWSIITTILTLTVAFFIAVKITASKAVFSKFIYGALIIPWGIPVYIGVPLWRGIIHGNGGESLISLLSGLSINLMTDPIAAFFSTVFVHIWLGLPVAAFVIVGALRKIPNNLIETGKIDGAHSGILIRHIYLPAVKGTLAALGVLLFVSAVKEFTLIYLMTSGGPPLLGGITDRNIIGATTTLGIFLYEIFGETSDFGISSAYAVFVMGFVILVLFFWLFAKGKLKNRNIPIILAAAAQPLLSGWIGLIFGILYCSALLKKRMFTIVFIIQLLTTCVLIFFRGFLEGFQSGILISTMTVILLNRENPPMQLTRGRRISEKFPKGNALRSFPVLFPVLYIFSSVLLLLFLMTLSFSKGNVVTFGGLAGRFEGFQNFIRLFSESGLHRSLLNTIFLSGTAAVITPVICFPAASFLAGKGKTHVALVLLGVQILSVGGGVHTLLPLYSQFIRLGLGDSYIPLILIYCYHALPFSLFTMTAFLEGYPRNLKDQAQIDGAGPLTYLLRIQIPTSLPVITTAAMITFMNGWNSFLAPLLFINDESRYTISMKLFSFIGNIGSANPQWNLFAAASVINLIIIAVLFGPLKRPLQTTALHDFNE